MSENYKKPPERDYEFGDAKLKTIKEIAERLESAIDSLKENLNELLELKGQGEVDFSGKDIDMEIDRYKRAIELNEEKIKDFSDAIEYWEKELKNIADKILEDFKVDNKMPN